MSGIHNWLILALAGIIYFGSAVTALGIPPPCHTSTIYKITLQTPWVGSPECVPNEPFLAPDPAQGSLSSGISFEKSSTVTGGISASVNVAEIWNFGVSASYSITTGTGKSTTVSANCPANIYCGLTATTEMVKVEGIQTVSITGWCNAEGNPPPKSAAFTAYFPRLDGNGAMSVTYAACTVGKGAPPLLPCPCKAPPNPEKPPPPTTGPQTCIITGNGVNYRTGPKTSDPSKGTYNNGNSVGFLCKTTGDSIDGNKYWDKTSAGNYVSQVYVDIACADKLPAC